MMSRAFWFVALIYKSMRSRAFWFIALIYKSMRSRAFWFVALIYKSMRSRAFCIFAFLAFLHASAIAQIDFTFRNNCITQCANCTVAPSADMATVFEITQQPAAGTKYFWDFGEPGTAGNTSSNATGSHQYCSAGKKTVTLTLVNGTTTLKSTKEIMIGQLPYVYLGKDDKDTVRNICKGQGVELQTFGKVGKPSYPVRVNWYPRGETTDNIRVDSSGCYSVQVTDPVSGCTTEAKMQVKICGDRDPNANINKFMNAWFFGNGAGILFNGSADNPKDTTGGLFVPEGVAKMTDPTNSLIFYTDGVHVFDRNKNPIQFAADTTKKLNGDFSNTQGVTIIPKTTCKGCQAEYYIFTLSKNAKGENQLFYSIVDMKLNKGKGGLSVINQLVSSVPSTSRIIASEGGQGFYWLITQDANSNVTRTYKISNNGISAPIVSPGGSVVSTAAGNGSTTKISIDNSRMAISIPGPPKNKIDLFDFDPTTGKPLYTYSIDLGISPPTVYGVEFSPNKEVLYVSLKGDGASIQSQILQFDLTSKDSTKTANSKSLVYASKEIIGALQIDPVFNTVIYISIDGSNTLAKITSPNGLLNSTDTTKPKAVFTRNAVTFSNPKTTSRLGLPPSIPSPPDPSSPPTITQTCNGIIFKHTVDKKLCDPIENERIDWKIYQTDLSPFPDRSGVMVPKDLKKLIYSFTGAEMFFEFKNSDTYVITAAISNACVKNYLLDAQEFKLDVLAPFDLPSEFNRICKTDAKIALDKTPSSPNLVYQWSNGDKTPIAVMKNPGGEISLLLSDSKTKCSLTKKTKVNFLTNEYVIPQKDFSICMDRPVPFTIQLNGGTKDLTFSWAGPLGAISSTNAIKVANSGNYAVKLTDKEGCKIETVIKVADKCDPLIIAPSIFTPNGDQKNDYFSPMAQNPARAKIVGVQIYNRWGELLFSKSDVADIQWDGKYNGVLVPQDSYVWVVQYKSVDYPERGILTQRGAVIVAY